MTEFDPIDAEPSPRSQVLNFNQTPASINKSLESKIKLLAFKKNSCPSTFIKNYRAIFNGLGTVDPKYMVDFIPPEDLNKFSNFISKNDFNNVERLFINLYLPNYLNEMHSILSKKLIDHDKLEDYIIEKYNLFQELKCSKETALKLALISLPRNLMIKLSINGALESIESCIRSSKLLESEIDINYKEKSKYDNPHSKLYETEVEDDSDIFIDAGQMLITKKIKENQEKFNKRKGKSKQSAGRPSQIDNLANQIMECDQDIELLDDLNNEKNVKRLKSFIFKEPNDCFKKD